MTARHPCPRYSACGSAAIDIMMKQIAWTGLSFGVDDGEANDKSQAGHLWRRRLASRKALAGGSIAVVELARRVGQWARLIDEACSASSMCRYDP